MHIAVCDDNCLELDRISALLSTYRLERNFPITCQTYTNGIELLADVKSGTYDLLLLDILMPGFTGMQVAREICTFDSFVKIIFLTSSPEFAVESYCVKARDYLLKPFSRDTLFPALDAILAEQTTPLLGFPVKTKSGVVHILYAKLVFVEVMNKRLYFYLSNGTVREVFAPLSEYEGALLAQKEFIKVHRSYVVNLSQMGEINQSSFVTYHGKIIPISRLLYAQVRDVYLKQLFLNKGLE